MGFSFNISISAFTVFMQGLLSFFSPCVLPLLPVYLGFLAGSGSKAGTGELVYSRLKTFFNTVCFILGISAAFFILGFGFTFLGRFFDDNRRILSVISGIIMILFGLYSFGFFKRNIAIEKERRLPFSVDRLSSNPAAAFILGFFFSFAWTPCIGPILSSVLLMASSQATSARAALLILVYTLGFAIPFLITGLFTAQVLSFLAKKRSLLKYTIKLSAILLILMGIMTVTGFSNKIGNLPASDSTSVSGSAADNENESDSISDNTAGGEEAVAASTDAAASDKTSEGEDNSNSESKELVEAPDFTLTDQNGITHTLSDYKGKTVFLNFWATWCPPCRAEMPDIQKLYENHGVNESDIIVLGVAAPNYGGEKSVSDIKSFLDNNGYRYPTVMDDNADVTLTYGITAYPTTFMINESGEVFGYVTGGISYDMMEDIISQTKSGTYKN